MDYAQKNAGYVTSHKLKAFARCGFCYEKQYIDMLPNPLAEDNDNFLIGTAFDDLMTYGDKEFAAKYEVVGRRSSKPAEKVQLTESMGKTILQMASESMQNSLFTHKYKKCEIECEIGGMKLRGELDHFEPKKAKKDPDNNPIVDLKTCANVLRFYGHHYLFQMAFYQLLVEEVYNVRVGAQLEVVDKFPYFARSRVYRFTPSTLFSERGRILRALDDLKTAERTGIYLPNTTPEEVEQCPYYGLDGHGRRTQAIII